MELFSRAKAVRLKSHHDKYLLAEDDEEHVCQDRNGSSRNARWSVELLDTTSSSSSSVLRLRSCYGRYLTASNEPFLLGMIERKVLQTLPRRLDSSVEWEPIRDGFQVRLATATSSAPTAASHPGATPSPTTSPTAPPPLMPFASPTSTPTGEGHDGPVMGMTCHSSRGLLAIARADKKVCV